MTGRPPEVGPAGFLNLCKESGPTSHDVVAEVRRRLGTRRVGHAGTLDPLAEGVLPVAVGRATRLVHRLAEADKCYYAEIVLGISTSTNDTQGTTIETRLVPSFDPAHIDSVLQEFVGEAEQLPPAFSALKVEGRRAYQLAREGGQVTLRPRRVSIYAIERRRWEWPILGFLVSCSKGTYVRSLARDLGQRLDVGASVCRLVRQSVGPFHLSEALSLAELKASRPDLLLPPDVLSLDEPAIALEHEELDHFRHGRSWPISSRQSQVMGVRTYGPDGEFAGIVNAADGLWQPKIVLLD